MQCCDLVECFFLWSVKSATAKPFENICFANFATFHIYLIQIISNLNIKNTLIFGFEYWTIQIHTIRYFIISSFFLRKISVLGMDL